MIALARFLERFAALIRKLNAAYLRFCCALVGHRPEFSATTRLERGGFSLRISHACRDCAELVPVPISELGSMEVGLAFGVEAEPMQVSMTPRPGYARVPIISRLEAIEAAESQLERLSHQPFHWGGLLSPPLRIPEVPNMDVRADPDRWSEEDSHANTAQVVEFGAAEQMTCWRCMYRPEAPESSIGLCTPCLHAIRSGDDVGRAESDRERMQEASDRARRVLRDSGPLIDTTPIEYERVTGFAADAPNLIVRNAIPIEVSQELIEDSPPHLFGILHGISNAPCPCSMCRRERISDG
jgi:hypothetical protein